MRMSQAWGVGGEGFRQRAQQGRGPEVGKSWGQPKQKPASVELGLESGGMGGEVLEAARGMDYFSKCTGGY